MAVGAADDSSVCVGVGKGVLGTGMKVGADVYTAHAARQKAKTGMRIKDFKNLKTSLNFIRVPL